MLSKLKNLADAFCVLFGFRTIVTVNSQKNVSIHFLHCQSEIYFTFIRNRQKCGVVITLSFEKGFKRFFVSEDQLDKLEDILYSTCLYNGLLFSAVDPDNLIVLLSQYLEPLNSYTRQNYGKC